MHNIIQEIRLTLRQVHRAPIFAVAIVIILALATGANSAIFSLLAGLWLRPLAVPHPTEVVRAFAVTDQEDHLGFSYPEYRELAKQSAAALELASIDRRGARVARSDGSFELVLVNGVTSNFFSTLGVQPGLGRLFDPSDDSAVGPEIAVLGDSYWRRAFGADPNIVGKQILVERGGKTITVTIGGVLPSNFRELDASSDREIWFPERTWREISNVEERGYRGFQIVGRLRPGVSRARAESKLQAAAAVLAQQWPDTNHGRRIRLVNDLQQRWEDAGVHGELLLAIVGLVMLLCAVNIANLFLARGTQRQHELSIRLSLGAMRSQLFLHMFVESVVLGLAGVAVGLLVGNMLIRVLPSLFVSPPNMHVTFTFDLDRTVMLASTMVGIVTTFMFGCLPALRASLSTQARITPGSANAGRPGRALRLHRWLVVAQVGISLVLLVGTGLVIRSFTNTRTADLGITRNALLNVWMTSPIPERPSLRQVIEEDLTSIPGVRRVAMAVRAPLSLSSTGMARVVEIPDAPQPPGAAPREILYNSVSANYLPVIGTPILAGRGFEAADERSAAKVIVISQTMAHTFWPTSSPLGRTVKVGKSAQDYRIVGIAKDVPIARLGEHLVPYMYVPYAADPEGEQTFILEYAGDPDLIAPVVRSRLEQLNSEIVVLSITTQSELIRYSASEYGLTAVLVSALGLLAMCLTAAGLYGTVSYGIARRVKEIGIRMALGATREGTMLLVMREIAWMAGVGLLIGLPTTLICTRLSAAAFFGVSPWHLPTLLTMAILVTVILFAAGCGPAYHASRIDPMGAIREE